MKPTALFILILALFVQVSSAEILSLKSADGNEIKGTITLGQVPGSVNIKRSDGKLFKNVPVTSLSLESQQIVSKALAKQQKEIDNADVTGKSRLAISFQRQKASNNNKYGDIDDRIVKIQPRVTVESDERHKTYRDIKGETIVIGKEAVSKDRWVILDRQQFNLAAIEPDEKITWEGKEFECKYDPDYAGWDYEGYVVFLRNKAGEIVMVKGSSPRWETVLPALLKARQNTGYDKTFSTVKDLRSRFGLPGGR